MTTEDAADGKASAPEIKLRRLMIAANDSFQ
jgi:hypothetical protein